MLKLQEKPHMTRENRKKWRIKAKRDTEDALAKGYTMVLPVAVLDACPVHATNYMLTNKLLRYVKQWKFQGGHSRAVSVLHAHRVLVATLLVCQRKFRLHNVTQWTDEVQRYMYSVLDEYLAFPEQEEAILGTLELELEALKATIPNPFQYFHVDSDFMMNIKWEDVNKTYSLFTHKNRAP